MTRTIPFTSWLVTLTVVLWLQSAPADTTINARSYGARGDGIHDDTQAIHLAIAALRPHSTLFFSCGTYLISSTLTISISDVTVTGVPGCAIIKSSGANGFAAMKVGGSGTGVKVPLLVDSGEQQKGFTADLQSAGIRVGDYAVLSDDLKGSAGGNAEVVRVVSVSGRNATTAEPLHTAFLRRNGSVVAKLEEAVTATVSHLVFDGSGNPNPDREGLSLVFAVNSGLTDVTAKDFAQAAIVLKYGHNNILRDLHIERAGSLEAGAVDLYIQTAMTAERVTVTNTAKNGFGVDVHQVHGSKLSAIEVAQNGAPGRAFKLYRSSWNTISELVVTGTGGEKNGISVTLGSSHNTFVNAQALHNTGLGIATFGDGNTFNTFIDCTAKFNSSQQFFQDASSDEHTTVLGGEFCCNRRPGFPVVGVSSGYFTIKNAAVWDDQHMATSGISFGVSPRSFTVVHNPTVSNNRFRGFRPQLDIDTGGAKQGSFLHNSTPEGISNQDATNTFVP